MAFSSYRKSFKGVLEGISIEELGELDYNKQTLLERKEYIDNKYKKIKRFYDTYITGVEEGEYYKVGLNKDDDLSSDINVFKHCERDGSYLLNSKDLPRDKQQEYRFLSEEEFKRLIHRERNNLSLDDPNVMEILDKPKNNEYKVSDVVINSKDFADKTLSETLMCYEKARLHLRKEMSDLKNKRGSLYDLGFLKRNLGSLMGDMVDCKKMLLGIKNPAKKLGDESGFFYSENIDYTSQNHIKAILKTIRLDCELEPENNLSHIALDMRTAIKVLHNSGDLDRMDLEIIECYNSGYSNVATGEELNLSERMVRYKQNKIFSKICDFFKKL